MNPSEMIPEDCISNVEVGSVLKVQNFSGGLFIITSVNRQTYEIKAEPITLPKWKDLIYKE